MTMVLNCLTKSGKVLNDFAYQCLFISSLLVLETVQGRSCAWHERPWTVWESELQARLSEKSILSEGKRALTVLLMTKGGQATIFWVLREFLRHFVTYLKLSVLFFGS